MKKRKSSTLDLIRQGRIFISGSLHGTDGIYQAKYLFNGGIDREFETLVGGASTKRMPAAFDQVTGEGSFLDLLHVIPLKCEENVISHNQLVVSCATHLELLSGGFSLIFFIKKNENHPVEESNPAGNLTVACVIKNNTKRYIYNYDLDARIEEVGGKLRRVIYPYLAASMA